MKNFKQQTDMIKIEKSLKTKYILRNSLLSLMKL